MRVRVKDLKEENVERILHVLTELGIDTGKAYASLARGLLEFEIDVKREDFEKLSSSLRGLCHLEVINEAQRVSLLASLFALLLDSLLVYYLVKASVYSDWLRYFLNELFVGVSFPKYLFDLLALSFIVAYFKVFLETKKAPPISSYIGLVLEKNQGWFLFAYSGILPSLHLLSSNKSLVRLFGFLVFCVCIAVFIEARKSEK